jgi:hypothetical protein
LRSSNQFASSPEARSLRGASGWYWTVIEFGRAHVNKEIAEIDATDLEDILFRIFPSEVICRPVEARSVVVELRAFFRFLRRVQGSRKADACLRLLQRAPIRKLERRLAQSTSFGVVKLFLLDALLTFPSESQLATAKA